MKSIKLALIICSTILFGVTTANAQDEYTKNAHSQNFMSKRPYHQPLPESAYEKSAEWEGATLVPGDTEAEKESAVKSQAMRMHMLGKRPY